MELRQELLTKLLNQELAYIKKKFYPYQRRTLLNRNVTIQPGEISEILQASGLYEKEGKDEIRYSHKITIDNNLIDKYLNYKQDSIDRFFHYGKKHYKKLLKQVIDHELIHCFCMDHYEGLTDIEGCYRDASPIFLSIICWIGGISTHHCVEGFKKTQLYKDVMKIKTFEELDSHLCHLLIQYGRVKREMKECEIIGDYAVTTSIEFSNRNAGMEQYYQVKYDYLNRINAEVKGMEINNYYIGCCIIPNMVKSLASKKRNNPFPNFEYKKIAVLNNSTTVKNMIHIKKGMFIEHPLI